MLEFAPWKLRKTWLFHNIHYVTPQSYVPVTFRFSLQCFHCEFSNKSRLREPAEKPIPSQTVLLEKSSDFHNKHHDNTNQLGEPSTRHC